MKRKLSLLLLCGVCVVAIGSVYYFGVYKKAHASIALMCGDISLKISRTFMDLSKPSEIEKLDQYGCYANADGCACAKKTSNGQGIVFGISGTNNIGITIPTEVEAQKTFLQSLGELMLANAGASTTVTHSTSMLKGMPTMTITDIIEGTSTTPTIRDFFFIHGGKLYDLTFQSDGIDFAKYWPFIEDSLPTLTFVK